MAKTINRIMAVAPTNFAAALGAGGSLTDDTSFQGEDVKEIGISK
jgi:hypothetical protein